MIGERQSPEAEKVEPRPVDVEVENRLEYDRRKPDPAERGDEGEGERDAGEIGGDAGKGHHRRANRQISPDHRQSDGKTAKRAEEGRGERYAERNPVGRENVRLKQVDDVLKCEMPVRADKGGADQIEGRHDQEHDRKDNEWRHAQDFAEARGLEPRLGRPAPTTGPGFPGPASGAISMAAVMLFHVRTNRGIPLLGDHLLGGVLLLDGGEYSLGVVLRRRQGIQQRPWRSCRPWQAR